MNKAIFLSHEYSWIFNNLKELSKSFDISIDCVLAGLLFSIQLNTEAFWCFRDYVKERKEKVN